MAVIGVGHLGSRHARVYAELPEAELVAVVDSNGDRAREVAAEYGVAACADARDLAGRVAAASVAVPTEAHRTVAVELLRAGVDVLVEKPMAADRAGAMAMIEAAGGHRILAVGHTERFNPAVEALFAQAVRPRFVEVHRLGVFSARSLDIDVVQDLMIHDLDVVSALLRSRLASVHAVGVPVLTGRVDIANARLRFENGAVANLTASRISQDKVRKLRVWEPDRYVSVDYEAQEAVTYRLSKGDAGVAHLRVVKESLVVHQEEPLKRELQDFLRAVQTRSGPRVPGEEGLAALELACRVSEALEAPV